MFKSYWQFPNTVEPVLKDHPIGHKDVVFQDRWSLVTGAIALKYRTFCQKNLVFQDRWSLMAVVSQDRFHCIDFFYKIPVDICAFANCSL